MISFNYGEDMNKACYRKLKRYKYQLVAPFQLQIGVKGYTVDTLYLKLDVDGWLQISKEYADLLLKKTCLEDGMPNFRANYVYQAVKLFGGSSAKPGSEKPDNIICVPI